MTIAQSTTIQAYQLRKGGTPARMAILRMIAADSVNNRNESTRMQPGDWRKARSWTMKSYAAAYCHGLSQGFNGSGRYAAPVWYCHSGAQFRDERYADECENGPDHRGWFTDSGCFEKARGVVGRLTHGRFIAGYEWSANGERVYFSEVFTEESDAANAADGHAESFAEDAREDNERFEAMTLAELDTEEKLSEVQKAFALRHRAKFGGHDRVREAIEALREAREVLREATEAYEKGQ